MASTTPSPPSSLPSRFSPLFQAVHPRDGNVGQWERIGWTSAVHPALLPPVPLIPSDHQSPQGFPLFSFVILFLLHHRGPLCIFFILLSSLHKIPPPAHQPAGESERYGIRRVSTGTRSRGQEQEPGRR